VLAINEYPGMESHTHSRLALIAFTWAQSPRARWLLGWGVPSVDVEVLEKIKISCPQVNRITVPRSSKP